MKYIEVKNLFLDILFFGEIFFPVVFLTADFFGALFVADFFGVFFTADFFEIFFERVFLADVFFPTFFTAVFFGDFLLRDIRKSNRLMNNSPTYNLIIFPKKDK